MLSLNTRHLLFLYMKFYKTTFFRNESVNTKGDSHVYLNYTVWYEVKPEFCCVQHTVCASLQGFVVL